MKRTIPFRHITKDNQLRVVQKDTKSGKLYLKNSDVEITNKQIIHKNNVIMGNNGKYVITKPSTPRPKTYEESWSESNLDGSFAYNGVTEDF
jgi:hypothetical protein